MTVVIQAEGLGKRYSLGEGGYATLRERLDLRSRRRAAGESGRREVWALRDLDLQIDEGDAVGIVGRNGAGKTTFLKTVARIVRPTTGVVRVRGRVGALLEVGTGFHPELTGRENVYLNGVVLGRPGDPDSEIDIKIGYIVGLIGSGMICAGGIIRQAEGDRARKPPGTI